MPVRHTRRQKRSLCLSAYAHERRYARGAYASPETLAMPVGHTLTSAAMPVGHTRRLRGGCPLGHTPRSFWGYIVQEKGEILQAIVEESEEWV